MRALYENCALQEEGHVLQQRGEEQEGLGRTKEEREGHGVLEQEEVVEQEEEQEEQQKQGVVVQLPHADQNNFAAFEKPD